MKKILKRCLVSLITCAFILTSLGTATAFAAGEGDLPRTGLIAPSADTAKLFKARARTAVKILPNEQGLERINEEMIQLGLDALPESFAAREGDEVVTAQNAGGMDKKYGATLSLYGVILDALPKSVDNSDSAFFPAIGDQGRIGSCSSFATAYYAATYETARARGTDLRAEPGRTLSPRFTYNLCNDGLDMGSSISDNILTMMDHGAPFAGEASMAGYQYNGYDFISGTTVNPLQYLAYPENAEIWRDALKNKLRGYTVIDDTNTAQGLTNIKGALNNGHVLVFGTDHVFDWKTERRVGNDPATSADDSYANQYIAYGMVVDSEYAQDGHAMTIVGYNDNIWVDINGNSAVDTFEKGALKIANSWGDDFWNDGYIWLSYDGLLDAHGHRNVIAGAQAIFLQAQAEYKPKATADVTVTTARRDKLALMAGMNWNEAKGPASYIHDFVFDGGWGGPYSLAGTQTASTGTIVVDMSEAAYGENYEEAGGALTLSLGVGDTVQSDTGESQRVTAVSFRAGGKTLGTVDSLPITVYHKVQWFDGKGVVNTETDPPAYAARAADLLDMPPETTVYAESTGATDICEWKFIPSKSGVYTFTNGITNDESTIKLLNEAYKVLWAGDHDAGGAASLRAYLYAGKTYVYQTYPTGTEGGSTIAARLHLETEAPASDNSASLAALALSGQSLDKDFDPDTLRYRAVLTSGTTTLDVTPQDTDAFVMIDGKVASSRDYTLDPDTARVARVDVTSRDWQKTRTYRVVLSYGEPSDDATLSGITLSTGTLAFDPETTEYSTTYPETTDSITLSATQSDPNASTVINGLKRNEITLNLRYGDTADVNITVTAEDLSTTRTYTVHVSKKDLDVISHSENGPLYDALKSAYPLAVDTDDDTNITAHELRQLSYDQPSLNLSGKGITDISALKYCAGLTSLNLSGNSIAALPDLSPLKDLNSLDLGANQLTALTGVQTLGGLRTLKAGMNRITGISGLSGMTRLQSLDLQGNRISDIATLSGLSGLYTLNLKNNYISNISALQRFGQATGRSISLELSYNLLNPTSTAVKNILTHLPTGSTAYSAQKTLRTRYNPGSHSSIGAANPYNGLYYESTTNYFYGQYEPVPYVRPDPGYHLLGWDTNRDGLPDIPRGADIPHSSVATDGVHKTNYVQDITAICAVVPAELNGKLFNIASTAGTLSSKFNSNTFRYTLNLSEYTASTTITPIKVNLENKMYVNGSSKTTSVTVKLNPGSSKTVKFVVYRDKKVKYTYSVTVRRAPSSNTNLSSLTASYLTPGFSNATGAYSITLPYSKKSVSIKAKASDKYSAVYINGRKATSKTITLSRHGQTATVTVKVKSQAKTYRTFTIRIKRI